MNPPYQIAAQNSWVKGVGAYTGEIAPELLKVSISGGMPLASNHCRVTMQLFIV